MRYILCPACNGNRYIVRGNDLRKCKKCKCSGVVRNETVKAAK